jgi:hypothetical protein
MKTKNSSRAPKDSTQGLVRYCNYFLEFPDGDVWGDFTHIVGGFDAWIRNTALWRKNPDRVRTLVKKGEVHWKDTNGVIHRMQISETPCVRKWGLNKKVQQRSAIEIVK